VTTIGTRQRRESLFSGVFKRLHHDSAAARKAPSAGRGKRSKLRRRGRKTPEGQGM